MKTILKKITVALFIFSFFTAPVLAAESVSVDAKTLLAHVIVSPSPHSGSFVEGSTFQIPITINTKGRSVNGIEVRVNYDRNKLSIVNPSGGVSIIGIWIEPPSYDNSRGTANYVGIVPGGIITSSGIIGTITFQAKAPGEAVVSIATSSKILLNDGLGTEAQVDLGRGSYSILPKAPEGVRIYSETHPVESEWYNNNSPTISWVQDPGVTGFSYVIDNQPNTVPASTVGTTNTSMSFPNLTDGLSYFHIKAIKNGVWGTAGHFLVRIDTAPPAEFKPEANYIVAAVVLAERTLVSFFTTDSLSGIDHYEVGVIDKRGPPTNSPVFVQAESPFQVPLTPNGKLEVVVRAVDRAGNVRDESVNVEVPFGVTKFVKDYLIYILIAVILIGLIMFIFHYLVSHRILKRLRKFREVDERENFVPPPPPPPPRPKPIEPPIQRTFVPPLPKFEPEPKEPPVEVKKIIYAPPPPPPPPAPPKPVEPPPTIEEMYKKNPNWIDHLN